MRTFEQKLLTIGNPKTIKSVKEGYLTAVLHFAPASLSGANVCPWSTEGCRNACLNKAGRGGIIKRGEKTNAIQEARIRKTQLFIRSRQLFIPKLDHEIDLFERKCKREGLLAAARLNGTSDIPWELIHRDLFSRHWVQWYDYTKSYNRMHDFCNASHSPFPSNYHLTFSRTEDNWRDCLSILASGGNVAVVFDTKKGWKLPDDYQSFEVIDGDESDLRFLDNSKRQVYDEGCIVGLRAKGPALKDRTGFVVRGF